MMPGERQHLIDTLQAILQPARRRLARSRLIAALLGGLEPVAIAVAAAGGMELVGAVIARGLDQPLPFVHVLAAVLVLAVAARCALWPAVMVARRGTSLSQAAEHLDSACDAHNRIATALSLVNRASRTPFDWAAINDGVARARAAAGCTPVLQNAAVRAGRIATAMAAGGVLAALAIYLSPAAVSIKTLPMAEAEPAIPPTASQPHDHGASDLPRQMSRATSRPTAAPTSAAARSESDKPDPTPPTRGAGGAAMPSTLALATSGNGRASAESGRGGNTTQSELGDPQSSRSKAGAGRGAVGTGAQARGTGERSSPGSIPGGSSGAGQTLAVENRWASRDSATSDEDATSDDERKLQDEAKGNQQRGGVQPSLPDRTAAPSRELGITGPQSGRPGTGRGGPSPAKKSRGAAALLMGVAMPDLIRGKNGPGPAAVSTDEMDPLTSPQQGRGTARARVRSEAESVIERLEIPWQSSRIVEQYLVTWHSLDRNPLEGIAGAGHQQSPPATSRPASGEPTR